MLVIIADDITGAAEIAGVCLRYGLRVRFEIDKIGQFQDGADVLVVATNTRSLSAQQAVDETRRIAESLKKFENITLFKKIDSAMRGHITAEAAALADVFGKREIGFFPANPAVNRIIRNGEYYVDNVPINETAFASDPDFPAKQAEVRKVLKIEKFSDKYCFFIPDIESVMMLEREVAKLSSEMLIAGSAAAFTAFLKKYYSEKLSLPRPFVAMGKRRVMICGSTHENSKQFIAQTHCFDVAEITLGCLKKLDNHENFEKWLNGALKLFNKRHSLIITAKNNKIDRNFSCKTEETFAKLARYFVENQLIDELFIEGGATAYGIMLAAGITSLEPINEFSAGVVRMKATGANNLYVTLKPGSYQWGKISLYNRLKTYSVI